VLGIVPSPPLGIVVDVRGGDDRLRLVNSSGSTVVVLGYEDEPYLRFGPHGVDENLRSPAVYLNSDRYGKRPVPAAARPHAQPRWQRVAGRPIYEWHDHRIHWMSTVPPPAVQQQPRKSSHLFDWQVPLRVSGQPFAIQGRLDYTPPPGGSWPWRTTIAAAALGGIAVAFASLLFPARLRGRRRPSAQSGVDRGRD
jgi:hypothetical protein